MEIIEAKVVVDGVGHYLLLGIGSGPLSIALTENKPNDIKKVFNHLILEIKKKEFNFEFIQENDDLYNLISKEYINQLNQEINSIRQEMIDCGLTLDKK